MNLVQEAATATKERLLIEEAQIAIGELAVGASGMLLNAVEIMSTRVGLASFIANCVVGGTAALAGFDHWDEAKRKAKKPNY